ncbi:NAD-dependent epimerase/dehydratase family protein [Telmatospirillum sp.]|uniref:NAD-dependent epimerase/dehydratase family protein n=1 Tax=Telmatospirillum sp. TaxID=2079197 RepID=UPI00284D7B8D|nr:NAD-dependent epimerase/dehydratase family protein [Telmatospirillum sp.]MDR3437878.1 NAD-dependent epimerase/dehydratase family protein [Telmatospirillum sp.]
MRKVCLLGAGYISQVHAESLRVTAGVTINAVVDLNESAARTLARQYDIPHVFATGEEAIASGEIDCVHVLTPPNLHCATALPFLKSGIPVLLEKPLAASGDECATLITAARDGGTVLGVNQNFVHHPAFARLRQAVAERRLGKPRLVNCLYNVPLRQMAARQFGHWMFVRPGNILLEQAVHPLSQIVSIAGPVQETMAMAADPVEISPGVPFYGNIGLMLKCQHVPAELRIALGQSFPFWQVAVICDDGVLVADILNNRFFTYQRTLWLEFFDGFLSGSRTAGGILRDSFGNAADYILSTAKLKPRTDSFFQSIRGSVGAFHKALDDKRTPELDGAFGAHLVTVCEQAAKAAFTAPVAPTDVHTSGDYDIAVLGGTGFIGCHVVRRLLADGHRVGVLARNTRNLAEIYHDDHVVLVRGDVRNPADVDRAIGNARVVVNLAHGGGGKTFEEIRAAMVGSAEAVARCCLAKKIDRLIHIGSIAGLYLGPQDKPVTGATPPDPQAEERADYARAKAECDLMLFKLRDTEGLPVCILRPGLVVGENGIACHSGVGFFNNDQYCVGWNRGRNPLPFVLVEDVADAIARTCAAPSALGHAYNLVGDVRLTAREYIEELAKALDRPLHFHPNSTTALWLMEVGKWVVKRVGGRKVPVPSRRDFLSRGLEAKLDCDDAKKDLGWTPVADRERFLDRGIRIYAAP